MKRLEAAQRYLNIVEFYGNNLKEIKTKQDSEKITNTQAQEMADKESDRHEKRLHLFIRELMEQLPY